MACIHTGILLLSLAAFAAAETAEATVALATDATEVAQGANFTIKCTVLNMQAGSSFHRIEKKFHDEPEGTVIATNSLLQTNFRDNPKYALTFAEVDNGIEFTYVTKDARPEDSGEYACMVYKGQGVKAEQKTMITVVDVHSFSVKMTVTRDSTGDEFVYETATEESHELMLDESEDFTFRIETSGSNPAPKVEVRVGSRSITDQFVFEDVVELFDGDNDQKGVRFAKTGEAVIHVDHSFTRGMTVEASVGEHAKVAETFTAAFSGYPPELAETCPTVLKAGDHELDVAYNCSFLSSEPPTLFMYYYRELTSGKKEMVKIFPGEYSTHYTLALQELPDGQTFVAMLYMEQVFPQMFKSHFLAVENSRGNITHEFLIQRDMEKEFSGSSQVIISALSVLTFTAAALLLQSS